MKILSCVRFVAFTALLSVQLAALAQDAATVAVQRETPFADDALIAGKVKRECTINAELPTFVADYSKGMHVKVQLVDKVDPKSPGRVLVMEILDAESAGNAFLGHHKSMTIRGKLYENGKQIGDFAARRNSMGGAFAGFKGSCKVLDRTAKALGKDIAEWLAKPSADAQLGELE